MRNPLWLVAFGMIFLIYVIGRSIYGNWYFVTNHPEIFGNYLPPLVSWREMISFAIISFPFFSAFARWVEVGEDCLRIRKVFWMTKTLYFEDIGVGVRGGSMGGKYLRLYDRETDRRVATISRHYKNYHLFEGRLMSKGVLFMERSDYEHFGFRGRKWLRRD